MPASPPLFLRGGLLLVAVGVALAALLLHLSGNAYISYDTAQYASVADNLLAGRGFATSFIHFTQHYQIGGVPVAQTVFPPGFPILIAAVHVLGVPLTQAPFAAALICYLPVAALVFALCRRSGVATSVALAAALLWFVLVAIWFNVLLGKSEALFTLLTLSSLACAVHGEQARTRLRWVAAAAVLGGLSVTVRYQGVAWVATLGAWYLLAFLRTRDRRSLTELALVSLLSAACVAPLLLRNLMLTDSLSGSPVGSVSQGASPAAVAVKFYWVLSELLGLSWGGLLALRLAEILLVVSLALIAVAAARRWRNRGMSGRALLNDSCSSLALGYVLVTALLLTLLGLTRASGYVNDRYLISLVPFVALLAAAALRTGDGAAPRLLPLAGAGCLALAVLLAQVRVYAELGDIHLGHSRYLSIERALTEEPEVVAKLREEVSFERPLLAYHGPLLGMLLQRPTLAPPAALLTDEAWTADFVAALVDRYRVSYVVHFPQLFDATAPRNANQPFLAELDALRPPPWLAAVGGNHAVQVYRVQR